MFYSFGLLALATLATAQKVLFEGSGYRATVYYGVNDGDVCGEQNGGPFPAKWAVTSGINDGYPFCTSKIQAEAKTLTQYNSNRIVAMNANMMANDREYWCGKEVQIFKDGRQIILDEGPFILMDGCAACTVASIIDVSAKAFTQMSGGKCGDNPEGFTVKVIDNDLSHTLGDAARGPAQGSSVYNPASGGDAAPAPQQPSSSSQAAPEPTPSSSPSSQAIPEASPAPVAEPVKDAKHVVAAVQDAPSNLVAAAEQPAASPAPAPAPVQQVTADHGQVAAPPAAQPAEEQPAAEADACKYGKWRCSGLQLQICNRAETPAGTAWETIASCASECSFTVSGSAVCQ